jgi:hypothetical protein
MIPVLSNKLLLSNNSSSTALQLNQVCHLIGSESIYISLASCIIYQEVEAAEKKDLGIGERTIL